MKRLFRFRYPKIFLFLCTILLAYLLFSDSDVNQFIMGLDSLKYFGSFIAGIFFGLGFTAPFSVGFFLVSEPANLFFAAILGGLGAFAANMLIFHLIRFSFMDEYKRLEHTKPIKFFESLMKKEFSHRVRIYLLYIFAGFIIASPLPDEIGDAMLAALPSIKQWVFAILTFLLSTLGIFILLSI